jgi:hypothetical protein
VSLAGPTPERLGLLGGRYKRLVKAATEPAERSRLLAQAIDSYERGMQLDLNEYYCASNLPSLYRQRRRKGDEERAQNVLRGVIAACERAHSRNLADLWLRPTLLGAAFDAADADKAEELVDEVETEGPAAWQLSSLLVNLETSVGQVADDNTRARLQVVLDRLKSLTH